MGFPNFSGPHRKKQIVPVKIARGRGEGKGNYEGQRGIIPAQIDAGVQIPHS